MIIYKYFNTPLKTLLKLKVDTCVILEKRLLSGKVIEHLTLLIRSKGRTNHFYLSNLSLWL